jgi:hypothetical protein
VIGVKLQARLGNQLFQYAFARAASSVLGCGFYLDRQQNLFYPEKYFDLPGAGLKWWEKLFFLPVAASSGATLAMRQWFYPQVRRCLRLRRVEIDDVAPDLDLLSKVEDRTYYTGYFQSEAFFAPVAAAVRGDLRPKEPFRGFVQAQQQRYRSGGRKICAVHVRGGDYAEWNLPSLGGGDMRLGKAYYDAALAPYRTDSSWAIVVATDDLPYAREIVGSSGGVSFNEGSEIEDLMLLADADAVVISNSSFAWWGAWIGERPGRAVIAPKYFNGFKLRRELPLGILPTEWETLESS